MNGRHPDNPPAATAGPPVLPDTIRKIQEMFPGRDFGYAEVPEVTHATSNEELALERIVAERTNELEKQVRALTKALDTERELNETQRQFAAMASHEFRTPLAIIDGAAQHLIRRVEKLSPEDLAPKGSRLFAAPSGG